MSSFIEKILAEIGSLCEETGSELSLDIVAGSLSAGLSSHDIILSTNIFKKTVFVEIRAQGTQLKLGGYIDEKSIPEIFQDFEKKILDKVPEAKFTYRSAFL